MFGSQATAITLALVRVSLRVVGGTPAQLAVSK
jgi:hypothetical protein